VSGKQKKWCRPSSLCSECGCRCTRHREGRSVLNEVSLVDPLWYGSCELGACQMDWKTQTNWHVSFERCPLGCSIRNKFCFLISICYDGYFFVPFWFS
jgi:hypothetical protein